MKISKTTSAEFYGITKKRHFFSFSHEKAHRSISSSLLLLLPLLSSHLVLLAMKNEVEQIDSRHNSAHDTLHRDLRCRRVALLSGNHQRKVIVIENLVELRKRSVERELLELTIYKKRK